MTEITTSAAIREARDSSGTAHSNAAEMLDAIAQISELQLRHDVFARIDSSVATTTIETIQQMAQRVKEDVLNADHQLWIMFEHVEELEKALPQPETLPAGMPNAEQVRAEDFAAALVSYERASAAMEKFHAEHMKPANDAYFAAEGTPEHKAAGAKVGIIQEDFDRFVDAQSDAIDKVMLAPAPDIAALNSKMQILVKHELFDGWNTGTEIGKVLAADTARLSQQGEA